MILYTYITCRQLFPLIFHHAENFLLWACSESLVSFFGVTRVFICMSLSKVRGTNLLASEVSASPRLVSSNAYFIVYGFCLLSHNSLNHVRLAITIYLLKFVFYLYNNQMCGMWCWNFGVFSATFERSYIHILFGSTQPRWRGTCWPWGRF